jgi:uncharacterized membrane protein
MPSADVPVYFKAVLRPNRPLPRPALCCLLAGVAAVNLFFGSIFVLRGAWPVSSFMGANVLCLAWALSSSNKAAKHREELRLTEAALHVDVYPVRGEPSHAELNPYWLRIHLEEPIEGRSPITLASHGRHLQIGSFLPPCERVSLACALRAALDTARHYHRPSTSIIE